MMHKPIELRNRIKTFVFHIRSRGLLKDSFLVLVTSKRLAVANKWKMNRIILDTVESLLIIIFALDRAPTRSTPMMSYFHRTIFLLFFNPQINFPLNYIDTFSVESLRASEWLR